MPSEEMRRAIEHGDTETVQLEMVNIADINHAIFYVAELDSSLTALQLAVYLGQINVVIFLLNKGVAVDSLSASDSEALSKSLAWYPRPSSETCEG